MIYLGPTWLDALACVLAIIIGGTHLVVWAHCRASAIGDKAMMLGHVDDDYDLADWPPSPLASEARTAERVRTALASVEHCVMCGATASRLNGRLETPAGVVYVCSKPCAHAALNLAEIGR